MALQQRKISYDHEYFKHYFLCRYIPKSKGSDRLSRSLVSFKDGLSPHRKAWTECAVSELRKKSSELEGALIIRALSHSEQHIPLHANHSLDYLGTKLAHVLSGNYQPELLHKLKSIPKLVSLDKTERAAALYQAYKFSVPERMPKRVLILDDILTSGATTLSILTAVLKSMPSVDVSIFTLAYTDYSPDPNRAIVLQATPYAWNPNVGWMLVAEDAAEYGDALQTLMAHIMNDSFA